MSEKKETPIFAPKPEEKTPDDVPESGNDTSGASVYSPDTDSGQECLSGDSPEPQLEIPAGKSLEEKLEEACKEKDRIYDLYLRKQAEFENFKKRLERSKVESIRYANESLICELLPVIDNFELALATMEKKEVVHSHYEGVELILKQLKDVLAKYDLVDVPTVGKPFDPAHHEAILQISSEEYPSNTVLEEHRKGYKIKEKLIRPAMVVVSKKKALSETTKDKKD